MAPVVAAELGINHNGDVDTALEMIREAAWAGCGAVKVQSFRVKDFLPDGHPDWDLFESCEIWPYLWELAEETHRMGLLFGVTCQVARDVPEAVESGADYLKVGSDCATHEGLIGACVATGLPTWVSTGMCREEDLERLLPTKARLMVCTSLYPCPPEMAHLRRLMRHSRGFSDHTESNTAAVIASFLGVEMIEKHFTHSRRAEGPDHRFSLEPFQMKQYVKAVNEAALMRGSSTWDFDRPPEWDGWQVPEGQLRPA